MTGSISSNGVRASNAEAILIVGGVSSEARIEISSGFAHIRYPFWVFRKFW
jgi:hypothetical protein